MRHMETIRLSEIHTRLSELSGEQILELARRTGIGRSTLYQYRASPEALKRARGSTLLAIQRALDEVRDAA